jgi:hypothetical protein
MERRLVLFASGFTVCAFAVGIFTGITNVSRIFLIFSAALAVLGCALIFTKQRALFLPVFGAAFYFAFIFVYSSLLYSPAIKTANEGVGNFTKGQLSCQSCYIQRIVHNYNHSFRFT